MLEQILIKYSILEEQSVVWNRKMTQLLLKEYKVLKEEFRNPKCKKHSLWTEIKKTFIKNGYSVSEEFLDRKFRNMKKTYKVIKDNNKKSATGRGTVNWEYYDDFEDIFHNDKTVNVGNTLSSLSETSSVTPASFVVPPPIFTESMKTPQVDETNLIALATPKKGKGAKLLEHRKKKLETEVERVTELKKIRMAIEKSNKIQEERNHLMALFLEKK